MAAYAPLLTNVNNRNWNPDAIAFNSSHSYGTPSYHMQKFFINSNGALLLNSTLNSEGKNLAANAIKWNDGNTTFLRVKVSIILMQLFTLYRKKALTILSPSSFSAFLGCEH